jgi:hypothetical protein
MSQDTLFGIVAYAVLICLVALFAGLRLRRIRKTTTVADRPCPHATDHAYGPHVWTQDGWVRVCKFCGDWDYSGGDDYDGGPK